MRNDEIVLQFSTCQPETWLAAKFPYLFDPSFQIRVFTQSPFSHVDLVWDDEGTLLGSSDSPKAQVLVGNPRGVAIRIPEYQPFLYRRRAHIIAPPPVVRKFRDYAQAQIGKGFDHEAISPRAMLSPSFANRDWLNPDLWYCAELMAACGVESDLMGYRIAGVRGRITTMVLLVIISPRIDVAKFWDPVPGLPLMLGESMIIA